MNNSTRNSVKLQQFIPVETRLMPSVTLSLLDKAAQLTLSDDQLTCFGCEVVILIIFFTSVVRV